MDGVGGVSRRQHSDDLEGTNEIVKRDTGAKVDIKGKDLTRREVAQAQQRHVGAAGGTELVVTGAEAAEIAGMHLPGGVLLPVTLPLAALALGAHALLEAHEQGEEQLRANQRDQLHCAVVGTLELPDAVKENALRRYADVRNSPAVAGAVLKLNADPAARAVLQKHCDDGIFSAKDFVTSNLTLAQYLKADPKAGKLYETDAAFREGFDAYAGNPGARTAIEAGATARNPRYAQTFSARG